METDYNRYNRFPSEGLERDLDKCLISFSVSDETTLEKLNKKPLGKLIVVSIPMFNYCKKLLFGIREWLIGI